MPQLVSRISLSLTLLTNDENEIRRSFNILKTIRSIALPCAYLKVPEKWSAENFAVFTCFLCMPGTVSVSVFLCVSISVLHRLRDNKAVERQCQWRWPNHCWRSMQQHQQHSDKLRCRCNNKLSTHKQQPGAMHYSRDAQCRSHWHTDIDRRRKELWPRCSVFVRYVFLIQKQWMPINVSTPVSSAEGQIELPAGGISF